MPTTRQLGAGTSDPLDFRYARPFPEKATLKAGAAFTAVSAVLTAVIPIAGANVVRIRAKASAGGSMTFAYLRPRAVRTNDADVYTATPLPHAAQPVVAATEFSVDILPSGESDLLVSFDGSATGAWDFLDVMQQ